MMVYTHVLKLVPFGVRSPMDRLKMERVVPALTRIQITIRQLWIPGSDPTSPGEPRFSRFSSGRGVTWMIPWARGR
jgi:hypothetical protein